MQRPSLSPLGAHFTDLRSRMPGDQNQVAIVAVSQPSMVALAVAVGCINADCSS